jgi:hypothetical protein
MRHALVRFLKLLEGSHLYARAASVLMPLPVPVLINALTSVTIPVPVFVSVARPL